MEDVDAVSKGKISKKAREKRYNERNKKESWDIKGSVVERALLRFIVKNFKDEYENLRNTKINVLHWKSFNPVRKRSTLVMQYTSPPSSSSNKHSGSFS